MMKYIGILLIILMVHGSASSQSFQLPVPEGWNSGIIPFPIEFAPQIPYAGEEHVRTAPHWREPGSETLWSYCYLWWINQDAKINEESVEQNLQAYYAGLVNRNIISRKIDSALVFPTTASFKKIKTKKGDDKTFEGSIHMLDYLSLKPIVLNVQVSLRSCAKEGKLAVFFAVSPQPKTHALWQQFKVVRDGFRCSE